MMKRSRDNLPGIRRYAKATAGLIVLVQEGRISPETALLALATQLRTWSGRTTLPSAVSLLLNCSRAQGYRIVTQARAAGWLAPGDVLDWTPLWQHVNMTDPIAHTTLIACGTSHTRRTSRLTGEIPSLTGETNCCSTNPATPVEKQCCQNLTSETNSSKRDESRESERGTERGLPADLPPRLQSILRERIGRRI